MVCFRLVAESSFFLLSQGHRGHDPSGFRMLKKKLPALCIDCHHRERYGRFKRCPRCQRPRFSAGAAKGWGPRRRDIEAKEWVNRQPANRQRPDLDALMADVEAVGQRAIKVADAISETLSVSPGSSAACIPR